MCSRYPHAARMVARNRAYNNRINTAAAEIEDGQRAAEYAAQVARIEATPAAERTLADQLVLSGHQVTVLLTGAFGGTGD